MTDNSKIVYCQPWTDGGYSLHRIKPDIYEFAKHELQTIAEVSAELGEPIICAVQGDSYLTRMNTSDCTTTLMTLEGRKSCGVKRYGECPSQLQHHDI